MLGGSAPTDRDPNCSDSRSRPIVTVTNRMAQSVPSDDTPESVDCPIVKKSYTKIIGNPLDKLPKLWYKVDRKEGKKKWETKSPNFTRPGGF